MHDVCAVVLAAGRSVRMDGVFKMTASLLGKPLVSYPVRNARAAGITRVVVVVGHRSEEVRAVLDDDVEYVTQATQDGTGHAAATAVSAIRDERDVVVLFGDCPFLDDRVIDDALRTHRATSAGITLATAKIRDPWSLGTVQRDDADEIVEITSSSDAGSRGGTGHEVFAGLSVWRADVLRRLTANLPRRPRRGTAGEQELPDAVAIHRRSGGTVSSVSVTEGQALGLNNQDELFKAQTYLIQRKVLDLAESDVRIPDFERARIDYDVSIGPGSVLRGNVSLFGDTAIGPDNVLSGDVTVTDSRVGSSCVVQRDVSIMGCEVGSRCTIGPHVSLADCTVGDDCVIGTGSWEGVTFRDGARAADRLRGDNSYFNKPQYLIPLDPSFVFMLMPFKEPYTSLFRRVIKPVVESFDLECEPAYERFGPGVVVNDVWCDINRAQFVVAEISDLNANVMYELGLAHALGKPTILLSKHRAEDMNPLVVAFNVRSQHILVYDPEKADLADQLRSWVGELVGRR